MDRACPCQAGHTSVYPELLAERGRIERIHREVAAAGPDDPNVHL